MIIDYNRPIVKRAPSQAKAQAFAGLSEISTPSASILPSAAQSDSRQIAATTEPSILPGGYSLKKRDSSSPSRYYELFRQIEENQRVRQTQKKDIKKRLLRERITGKWGSGSENGFSYLEYNAQLGGDLQSNDIIDLKYAENVSGQCGKSAVWLSGVQSHRDYIKLISCRKQWCPKCGGKGGKIHKSRLHAVQSRLNPEKVNIQQFVFPPPAHLRETFKNRANIEKVNQEINSLMRKELGKPVFDSKGHIKKYKLEDGALLTFHAFGETLGEYKPHWNVQIVVQKNKTLKLSKEKIESFKNGWLKIMRKFDSDIEKANIHYSFRNTPAKVMHSIKYMIRPWSADDYNAIEDDSLKSFLVLEMSGFQYLRFWGALSSRRYQDEMDLSEVKYECEEKVGEKLIFKFIAPFDLNSWLPRLEEVDDGLYRVKQKGVLK